MDEDHRPAASRFDAFRALAEARARGEMVLLPRMLRGPARREHVRQTLREDHRARIAGHDDDALVKFEKLAGSLFSFFRGTALLFYRDMAGEDAWMPTVLTLGDVHPDNYGVTPSADDVPVFSVDDFDEAFYAPFTWDIKRGAVGFMIGAEVEGGLGRKDQRAIAAAFVGGYVDGIERYAASRMEDGEQMRRDNAPPLIADLLDKATKKGRAAWLADKYLDETGRGFKASKKLVPISSRRDEFQAVLDRFVAESELEPPARAGEMHVKDVCERKGQGTASLGLARYYLLVEGPAADGTDDLILELKQARPSALAGVAPPSAYTVEGMGDRISHAHSVQLVRGDVFFGSVEHEDLSFMVRERAPYKKSIDLDELSKAQWRDYAAICGGVLAQAHALSDETGEVDHDVEPEILRAMGSRELFIEDVLGFATDACKRLHRDHACFRRDHAMGAFGDVDVVFR